MSNLDPILSSTEVLAQRRALLQRLMQQLNAGIEALKADQMPEIRNAIDSASEAWSELEGLVRSNAGLFVKPRTVAAHGITVGIEKAKGSLEIPDPERTVRLIRKHLPEQEHLLVVTRSTPVKAAVAKLPANELKRIGVHITEAVDRVVIRPAETEVDKLVKALVQAKAESETQAEEA